MIVSLGVAILGFWLAMILVAEISLKLNWLPATGAKSFTGGASGSDPSRSAAGFAIAAYGMPRWKRQLRGSCSWKCCRRTCGRCTPRCRRTSCGSTDWKNVAVNLFTIISLLVNRMLAATVVIEAVFAIPGLGSLIVRGAIQRDFPIVQGVVFTMVIVVIAVNLIADLLCAAVDPRIEQ
jgi:peptide/nickel transport system permease protein